MKGFIFKRLNALSFLVLFFLVFSVSVNSQLVDSDGDGVSDDFDMCPNTPPRENLPIVLRNPEFLGCSCSQIFEIMKDEFCVDIYCHPGRPLEIRERSFSARPNPCPPKRCDDSTLYVYSVDVITCFQGKEMPYNCTELVIEDAEECLFFEEVIAQPPVSVVNKTVFYYITKSYFDDSELINIFRMKDEKTLQSIHEDLFNKVSVERLVEVSERKINNKTVYVKDVTLVVSPRNYFLVEDFVFVERLKGDFSDSVLIVEGDHFFDDVLNLIIWEKDSLSKKAYFKYRVTPSVDLDFETVLYGTAKSSWVYNVLFPFLMLVILISFFVFWVINKRNKSNVFKT